MFLNHFCVEGAQAMLEPFSVFFLWVSCSQLSPGSNAESQHFWMSQKSNSMKGGTVGAEQCLCAQKLASLWLPEQRCWTTNEEQEKKSNLTLHLWVHVQIPRSHQLDKIRNICLLLFHIAFLRSLSTLKCQLSHPSLLSCCASSVAVPLFKVTINEARPDLGTGNSSSDPCVQIPYFLTPSEVQYKP